MSTMLIAFNGTRENGNFMGDQLCYLKAARLFVQNTPDVDKVVMSLSPNNEMGFVWSQFLKDPRGDETISPVEVVFDSWHPGDWTSRWMAWDKWRTERHIEGREFQHYREMFLRIHGAQRQQIICGSERGLGRRNIYEYVYYGQENMPETCIGSGVYDIEIEHPSHMPIRDIYISPHSKTQGNVTFDFPFWSDVVHRLIDAGVTVTVGYDGHFCEDLCGHSLYKKHWGDHRAWMEQVCRHKLVACGNTGTGWLAAACGVPMITMEPENSVMADHRYRECGLRNIVEVVSEPDAEYVARRIIEEVRRCVVMTTGCYDVLHAGHVRHLERARSLGTKLIVVLNSDASVRSLKGPSRPINPQDQRKAVLEALRSVDEVRITDDPLDLVREVRPDVLAVGYGYTVDSIVGREFVESYGGRAVVTCRGDASNEPSTTKVVQRVRAADVVEICRLGAAHSVNPLDKLKLMADQFLSVKDLPGDVADLGACRGGTSLILRRLAPDKDLHVFDNWDGGTPYDDPLCHHKKGEWAASQDECMKLVGSGPLTNYHPGIFPQEDWGEPLDCKQFCFVFVDMDVYVSICDAIDFFWPRMVSGGKIMFDDWNWEPCAGVKKAILEKFSESQLKIYESLYTCMVIK